MEAFFEGEAAGFVFLPDGGVAGGFGVHFQDGAVFVEGRRVCFIMRGQVTRPVVRIPYPLSPQIGGGQAKIRLLRFMDQTFSGAEHSVAKMAAAMGLVARGERGPPICFVFNGDDGPHGKTLFAKLMKTVWATGFTEGTLRVCLSDQCRSGGVVKPALTPMCTLSGAY